MATPMRSTDFRAVVEPIINEVFDGVYEQRDDEWKGFVQQIQGIPRNPRCLLTGILRSPSSRSSPECRYNERTEFSLGPSSIAARHWPIVRLTTSCPNHTRQA